MIGWVLLGTILAATISILWSEAIGAGFEPTSGRKVKAMLELAGVGPGDVVYDLGSGDGRIVIASANLGATAVGLEADVTRVMWSRLMVRVTRTRSRCRIVWGNFFKIPIREATVVTTFLSVRANKKLSSKLREELRPGSRVVTYVWQIEGWSPERIDAKHKLYLYVI